MKQHIFVGCRAVMVWVESMVSGHRIIKIRERLADKLEFEYFDPWGKWTIIQIRFCKKIIIQ